MTSLENRIMALIVLIVTPLLLWPLRKAFTLENLKLGLIMAIVLAVATALLGAVLMLAMRLWDFVRGR